MARQREASDIRYRKAKPGARPYKLADRDGLYLYVTPRSGRFPKGAKSWRFDYRIHGKRETLTIGLYPDVSLEQARNGQRSATFISLADARAMVARGESPAQAKKTGKVEKRIARANTLKALAERWYAVRADARSASWRDNARRWLDKDIYPAIGDKPIREVSEGDLEELLRGIHERRGAKSAHYARLLLAGIYKAKEVRALQVGNPARDLADLTGEMLKDAPKATPRGRPLTPKGIPAMLEAADRYPGRLQTKLALRLLMLTFTRKRELIETPWEEIDLERAEWVIPPERMKMERPHIVPLSRQAVECFGRLKPLSGGSRFVFPNIGDPRRPMSPSTLNKMLDTIGYEGRFTPHSARSTASTILNGQGWSADAIERQLAHTERDIVRAAYNHADFLDERRRMMQAWADYLDALTSGATILPIRGRAA